MMTQSRRWGIAALVAGCVFTAVPPAFGQSGNDPRQETDELVNGLYGAVVASLRESLTGPHQLMRLPRSITGVYAVATAEPVFELKVKGREGDSSFASFTKRREGGFRVVIEGKAIGANPDGVLAGTSNDMAITVMVCDGDKRSYWGPNDRQNGSDLDEFEKAHWINGRWVMQAQTRLIDEESNLYPPQLAQLREHAENNDLEAFAALRQFSGSFELFQHGVTRTGRDGEVIVVYEPRRGAAQHPSFEGGVTIGVFGESESIVTFPSVENNTHGAYRTQDGTWIAIGDAILPLDSSSSTDVPEKSLEALIKAVDERDLDAILAAAEVVSRYRNAELKAKMREIAATVPEAGQRLARVEKNIATLQSELATVIQSAQSQPLDATLLAELHTLRDQLAGMTEQIEAHNRRATPANIKLILGRIASGYQYLNGEWIMRPQLLTVRRDGAALLHVHALSNRPESPQPVRLSYLAMLGPTGQLKLLAPFDGSETGRGRTIANMTSTRLVDGRDVVHVAGLGVFIVAGESVDALDCSESLREMDEVIGSDSSGRIYFARGHRTPREYWAYCPGRTAPPAARPALATYRRAALDDRGHLWFVRDVPRSSSAGTDNLLPVDRAEDVAVTWVSGEPRTPRSSAPKPTLYCYRDGRFFRYFTTAELSSCDLVAGINGMVITIPMLSRTNPAALIIHGNQVHSVDDLHALATKEPEFLEALLPAFSYDAAAPNGGRSAFAHDRATLGRLGDTVWIGVGGVVEAYRGGVPQDVMNRLRVLHPGAQVSIAGYFAHAETDHGELLIACETRGRSRLFYLARVEEGGVTLAATMPSGRPGNVENSWPPDAWPRIAPAAKLVAMRAPLQRTQNIVMDLTDDAPQQREVGGTIVGFTPDGTPIVERTHKDFGGFMIGADADRVIISPSMLAEYTFITAPAADHFLFAEQDRPVWIHREEAAFGSRALAPIPGRYRLEEFLGHGPDGSLLFGAVPRTTSRNTERTLFEWKAKPPTE